MASNYKEFFVQKQDKDGNISGMPNVSVKVHDMNKDSALTTLTTDAAGKIAAGSVSSDAGTRIAFRVENEDGLAGSIVQITN